MDNSTTTKHSQLYFQLRGKCVKCLVDHDSGLYPDCGSLRDEINKVYSSGGIQSAEAAQLLGMLDDLAPAGHSPEFEQLRGLYEREIKANGVLTSAAKQTLEDEIQTSYMDGNIEPEEYQELCDMVNNAPTKVVSIRGGKSIADLPSRKKAAAKRSEHSLEYKRLVQEYKDLYKESNNASMDARTERFIRNVERAYKEDSITLSEYQEFQQALGTANTFLSDVDVPTSGAQYDSFRTKFLDYFRNNNAIAEIAKQVNLWAKARGVSEEEIASDPIGVALAHLDEFMASGEKIVNATGDRAHRAELLQLKFA